MHIAQHLFLDALKVRVLGQDYTVRSLCPRMSEAADAIGYCDHTKLEIYIRTDLPYQKVAETMLHELFHCLLYATHSQEESNEERQVDRLGRSMACLMRDNPELFLSIAESLK